jgi:hypothetical protein
MKRIVVFTLGFFSFCSSPNLFHSVRAQSQDRGTGRSPAQLTSYEVVQLELKKPVKLRDAEGKEQSYDRAYLVTLKGTFPADQAMGLELFIGDYRIPEYGGKRDGLYFRIYDAKLLERLEDKDFRYRFGSPEIRSFNMHFSTKASQPLKIQKEQ